MAATVTFTRASTATYFDASGVLQSAAIDTPRFDHDPSTLESLGLLIEESRQNSLAFSSQFDINYSLSISGGSGSFTDGESVTSSGGGTGTYSALGSTSTVAAIGSDTTQTFSGTLTGVSSGATRTIGSSTAIWQKTRTTITKNAAVAPDGATTADKLVENTATGQHHTAKAFAFTSGSTYTLSCFVKAAERNKGTIQLGNSVVSFDGGNALGAYDLVAKTITRTNGLAAGIEEIKDGWFRVWIAGTAGSTASDNAFATILNNGSITNYTGDGVSGLYIWGAQLEVGTFPTSYIPTTTTALTRSADVASLTGTNFSSWYNQTEGTFVATFTTRATGSSFPPAFAVNDMTTNNQMNISYGATQLKFFGRTGGVDQFNLTPIRSTGSDDSVACCYKANDIAYSLNSATALTGTSATIPTVNQLEIGKNSSSYLNGHIARITYFPIRLSNTNLKALST